MHHHREHNVAQDLIDRIRKAEERKQYIRILEDEKFNNLPFTWDREDADPDDPANLSIAFSLAGQADKLKFVPYGLFTDFYITDNEQGDGDSKTLALKYSDSADSLLQIGRQYFLCQSGLFPEQKNKG